jgi:thioredoxin reductase
MAIVESDITVVGGGPAGLFAAYYAGMRGLSVTIADSLPLLGGQTGTLYPEKYIYDVAGFPAVKGRELVEGLVEQAMSAKPRILLNEECLTLENQPDGRLLLTTSAATRILTRGVVVTAGIGRFTPRVHPVVDQFAGRGVEAIVGPPESYAGRHVVVVGGGDSAIDWAGALVGFARSVTVVHRRARFTAHESSVETVRSLGVRLVTDAEVVMLHGTEEVHAVTIRDARTDVDTVLEAETVIPALGHIASLGSLADWGLALEGKHIVVGTDMTTTRDGVYAAGDITTYPGKVRLMVVGFGEAATAVNNLAVRIHPGQELFPGHSSELPRLAAAGKDGR